MKLAFVVLLALSSYMLVEAGKNIFELDSWELNMKPMLGHFSQDVFTVLYNTYVVAYKKNPGLDHDNNANYRPTADVCYMFFVNFQANDFKVNDLDDVIVMDACLGYLFDKEGFQYDHAEDQGSITDQQNDYFVELAKQDTLKNIYFKTKISDAFAYTVEDKNCVANLLYRIVSIKKDLNVQDSFYCDDNFLQIFLQFAECQANKDSRMKLHLEDDSYVAMIYRLVKERGQACFSQVMLQIDRNIRRKWGTRPHRFLPSRTDRSMQNKNRRWPSGYSDVLAIVQGAESSEQINVRYVLNLLNFVSFDTSDKLKQEEFLKNVAKSADRDINPRGQRKNTNDPSGLTRYQRWVDSKCKRWRMSDAPLGYDYALAVARMVEAVNYYDVFELTPKQLVKKFYVDGGEISLAYTSIVICYTLSFTQGTLMPSDKLGKYHYKVLWQANLNNYKEWPLPTHA